MTGKQKILQVLKKIKQESEINPDPEWVEFKFNNVVVIGADMLTDNEEKRILVKLENEGILEIHLPSGENEEVQAMLSSFTPIEFMMEHNSIWIKILQPFYKKYYWHTLTSFGGNDWNRINPFWIFWQLSRGIWAWVKKHKIVSGSIVLLGLIMRDYAMAWQNINIFRAFFRDVFGL